MNFWQFLDRQIDRFTPTGVAGAGIFLLTGVVLYMLGSDPELSTNDLFKTLSQAIVVQGLVGLAMAAWFTTKSNDGPTGTPSDPLHAKIDNPPTNPANVTESKKP